MYHSHERWKFSCKDLHVKESMSVATYLKQQVLTGQKFIKMIVNVLFITGHSLHGNPCHVPPCFSKLWSCHCWHVSLYPFPHRVRWSLHSIGGEGQFDPHFLNSFGEAYWGINFAILICNLFKETIRDHPEFFFNNIVKIGWVINIFVGWSYSFFITILLIFVLKIACLYTQLYYLHKNIS